jgi:hypothetical protein
VTMLASDWASSALVLAPNEAARLRLKDSRSTQTSLSAQAPKMYLVMIRQKQQ